MRSHIRSKWAKTKVLLDQDVIRQYVPETKKLTLVNLLSMLHQYKMVYLKPNIGTFGNGVMRVEQSEKEGSIFRYQIGLKKKKFADFEQLYRAVRKETAGRAYLVQKGIHLTKYKKRPFDIRVMVQQSPRKKWVTTGLIGRVAHPKKVVTNYHSGGTPLPVDQLLSSYIPSGRQNLYIDKLADLGVRVAKQMHKKYPGIKEIGVDVALDSNLNPWILEVNTHPDPYIFKKLKDKQIFRKIYRYAKAYGRV